MEVMNGEDFGRKVGERFFGLSDFDPETAKRPATNSIDKIVTSLTGSPANQVLHLKGREVTS